MLNDLIFHLIQWDCLSSLEFWYFIDMYNIIPSYLPHNGTCPYQWHLSLPTPFNTGITDLHPETIDAGDVDLSPHAFPFTEPLPQSLGDLLQWQMPSFWNLIKMLSFPKWFQVLKPRSQPWEASQTFKKPVQRPRSGYYWCRVNTKSS